MYSEGDIDSAVAARVLSPQAADAFRDHVAARHAAPAVDEEHFRLLTGFNDIFVAIALLLALGALARIGGSAALWLGGALVAAVSWGLAEYFTRRRRMALPSILLLLGFVGGVGAALAGVWMAVLPQQAGDRIQFAAASVTALACVAAAWLHWRRFMVPITVAAGAVAAVGVLVGLVLAAVPAAAQAIWPLLLAGGLGVFAVAVRWDMSDPERRTRRSDVAFWLHLAAAPMIAHPVFQLLGVFRADPTIPTALLVLVLYVGFAVVALAVDRRALLVSSLAYVLYAMYALFARAGVVELSAAFTALAIGAALLTLSVFWQPMRRRVVGSLGGWARRLPPVVPV